MNSKKNHVKKLTRSVLLQQAYEGGAGEWGEERDELDEEWDQWDVKDCNEHASREAWNVVRLSWEGNVKALTDFLEAHPKMDVDEQDGDWNLALHEAINQAHPECVKLLLNHGSNVKVLDRSGQCALTVASRLQTEQSARSIITLLVKAGADIEYVDGSGRTAFLSASAHLSIAAAQVLMDLGADTGALDAHKKDAWDLASDSIFWRGRRSNSEQRDQYLDWLHAVWERVALEGQNSVGMRDQTDAEDVPRVRRGKSL